MHRPDIRAHFQPVSQNASRRAAADTQLEQVDQAARRITNGQIAKRARPATALTEEQGAA